MNSLLHRTAALVFLALSAPPALTMPTPTQGVRPLASAPKSGSAQNSFREGVNALKAKQTDEAKKAFNAALRADPNFAPAMLGLVEVATQGGNDQEALKWLQQAERAAPALPDVHLAMARFYLARKQPDKAEPALRKAVELDPKGVIQRLNLAEVLSARGADREALPLLRQVIEMAPQSAGAHFGLGRTQLRLGARAEGEQALRKAAELEPKNPLPWLVLAQAQTSAAAALPLVEQALARQADFFPALMLRAHWQATGKDLTGARATLERAAKANGASAEPLVNLAMLEEEAGRRNEARRLYLAAVERDAHHPIALNNLVMIGLDEKDDPARLELMARRAVKALPDNPRVQDTLAQVLRQRKDKAGALAAAQRAAKLAPSDPALLLSLAEIQQWAGDRAAAARSAQAVLALQATGKEADKAKALLARR